MTTSRPKRILREQMPWATPFVAPIRACDSYCCAANIDASEVTLIKEFAELAAGDAANSWYKAAPAVRAAGSSPLRQGDSKAVISSMRCASVHCDGKRSCLRSLC